MSFTHAVVDDGDIIRKYRWSKREAKWYKDSHPDIDVIELPKTPKCLTQTITRRHHTNGRSIS
jgi:hypothetical protein